MRSTGLLVYFGGLLFFEKAAVIPFVAFTIAALHAHVTVVGLGGGRCGAAGFGCGYRRWR